LFPKRHDLVGEIDRYAFKFANASASELLFNACKNTVLPASFIPTRTVISASISTHWSVLIDLNGPTVAADSFIQTDDFGLTGNLCK
jgi:hypothetical protein